MVGGHVRRTFGYLWHAQRGRNWANLATLLFLPPFANVLRGKKSSHDAAANPNHGLCVWQMAASAASSSNILCRPRSPGFYEVVQSYRRDIAALKASKIFFHFLPILMVHFLIAIESLHHHRIGLKNYGRNSFN